MLSTSHYKRYIYTGLVATAILTSHLLTTTVGADEIVSVATETTPAVTAVVATSEPIAEPTAVNTEASNPEPATVLETPVSSETVPQDNLSVASVSAEVASVTEANPTITIGEQVVEVTYDKPEVAPIVQTNQPDRIVATLTENPTTEAAFNWYTKDALPDASVEISDSEDMSQAIVVEAQAIPTRTNYVERIADGAIIYQVEDLHKDGTNVEAYFTDKVISTDNRTWTSGATYGYEILKSLPETINRAIVTGLKPNTTYYYTVGTQELKSPVGTFKTASFEQSDFKFIHYTDTQSGVWNQNVRNEAEFGARTLSEALKTAGNANFALHTGDVVEISEIEDEWRDVMNRAQEGYLAIPHVVASGNHDTYKTSLNDHFNLPINNEAYQGSYYSFDYNGAHFAIVNTNDNAKDADNEKGAAISDTQLAWLEDDLATARKNGTNWLIVAYHKPLYSSSYHSLQDADVQAVRERLISLLDKYDVDLVLNGHDHVLTTTKPLVANLDAFADGEVDVTTKTLTDSDGNTYLDTNGTLFVIPNAAGTKKYDDIFNESLEHIKKVRPKLSFMTQENLDAYRKLFDRSAQPSESANFKVSHSNQRESILQNFGIYTVTPDELKIDLYQVEGNVLATSEDVLRDAKLVVSYTLVNQKFDLKEKNEELHPTVKPTTDTKTVIAVTPISVVKRDETNVPIAKGATSTEVGQVVQDNNVFAKNQEFLAPKSKTLPKTGEKSSGTFLTLLGVWLMAPLAFLFKKDRQS